MHAPGWMVFGPASRRFHAATVPIEEGGMQCRRNSLAWLLATVLAAAGSGCHAYANRFKPARDQPRAVERADDLVTATERALDNVRQQADNIVD